MQRTYKFRLYPSKEKGVRIHLKSPWKTSQRCPLCGNIDRRNRKADRFRCIICAFKENADIVGAMNLKALGLAGAYSLRFLQANQVDICP